MDAIEEFESQDAHIDVYYDARDLKFVDTINAFLDLNRKMHFVTEHSKYHFKDNIWNSRVFLKFMRSVLNEGSVQDIFAALRSHKPSR